MKLSTFLDERRQNAEAVILDGAVGTELNRRGFAIDDHPLWSVHALNHRKGRQLLQEIHRDYAEAGADIVTANTFRINPRLLDRYGMLGKGAELAVEAVSLARRAAPGVFVAGSMSPLESCYTPSLVPDTDVLYAAHRLSAVWLAAAGVDLILIETMTTIRESVAALAAARELGLPAVVSFCCGPEGRLLGGESLEDAIQACEDRAIAIAVNCVAVGDLGAALRILSQRAVVDKGFYANFGALDGMGHWEALAGLTPDFYAAFAEGWRKRGIRWVGGCCGSTPEHIAVLAKQGRAMRVAS